MTRKNCQSGWIVYKLYHGVKPREALFKGQGGFGLAFIIQKNRARLGGPGMEDMHG